MAKTSFAFTHSPLSISFFQKTHIDEEDKSIRKRKGKIELQQSWDNDGLTM